MKLFLDANILISVLNNEYPLFTWTSRILSLADNKKYTVYTSPVCLAIAFYFAEKKSGAAKAKQKISLLVSKIAIAGVDKKSVVQSLENKKVNDFEDGIEYYAAIAAGCKLIITEDTGDFHFASIPVVNARDFVEKYLL